MLFTDAITWNGQHSYYDYGLSIRKPSGDMPKMQTNEVRVPYMQGSYIFSFVVDSRGTYSRRKYKIVFNIEGDDPTDLYRKRTKAIKWLKSKQGGELRFDSIPDAYFKDVYVDVNDYDNTYNRHLATITAEFSCYPFMILDYSHPAYYTATSTLTNKVYTSTIEDDVCPAFTTSSVCIVRFNGKNYTIPANSERYQLTDIVFSRGDNTFGLQGAGELRIETFEEVL